MKVLPLAERARQAAFQFRRSTSHERKEALLSIAENLENSAKDILRENLKDVEEAQKNGLGKALIDRILLTRERLEQVVLAVRDLAFQNEVLGILHDRHTRPDGLIISRERIPLGVIGMIFEGRPNVVVDSSCLSIKSGNAILLKGGSEAKYSNIFLSDLIRDSIKKWIPQDVVQLLDSTDREGVAEMLTLKDYIDVIIPRGGEGLIRYVYENSAIPVIAHFKGLCHIYVHEDADPLATQDVCINAKTSRPGVCNAMETLLVHEDMPAPFLQNLITRLEKEGVEIRGCSRTLAQFPHLHPASEEDWSTEYLDNILSLKIVQDEDEAIGHIRQYGTRHTEGICSTNPTVIEKFQLAVDCSCLVINASTRFNDGGELGLGAELGISTTKFHAYGPMGAKEMTTTRFIVEGKGHIR